MEGGGAVEIACTDSPEIPLDILKNLTVEMLTAAVWAVGQDVRDPPGGNIELLLVPLLRLFYNLLVMGISRDEDLEKILRLMDQGAFASAGTPKENEEEEESSDDDEEEQTLVSAEKSNTVEKGLFQMKLPEAVKLEVNFMDVCSFWSSVR